jgi:hypothetical protein
MGLVHMFLVILLLANFSSRPCDLVQVASRFLDNCGHALLHCVCETCSRETMGQRFLCCGSEGRFIASGDICLLCSMLLSLF